MEKPEKMKMESTDGIADNIRKIAELFPQVMTETMENGVLRKTVNFDKLKQLLSAQDLGGTESYEFTWVGKRAAMMEANTPIRKTLRPCPDESKDWDTTQNLYIEGDNLEVLKLLQENYLGKVKMIYIDPPYNTGGDFIYNDDFILTSQEYDEASEAISENGNRLYRNTDANGRFHSVWCSMIYARLLVARSLLREDGLIFISIDDNEYENLSKIANEVFSEENFVNIITVKTKIGGVSGSSEGKSLKDATEFILIYAKNKQVVQLHPVYTKERLESRIRKYASEGKSWKYVSVLTKLKSKKLLKEQSNPPMKFFGYEEIETKSISSYAEELGVPESEVYNRYADMIFQTTNAQSSVRQTVMQQTAGLSFPMYGLTYIPTKGKNAGQEIEILYKGEQRRMMMFLSDAVEKIDGAYFYLEKINTLWEDIQYNNLTKEGDIEFPNGKKPIKLLQRIIELSTDDDDIVLDFFSGSASTAHAVMKENAERGKSLKFIMVQIPEPTDGNYYEQGLATICEIGKERIRRAGEAVKLEMGEQAENLDVGFRVFKVDDSNMADVYYSAANLTQERLKKQGSNIKPKRNDLDLFFGCILDWGLELSLPYTSEELEGCKVHTYNDGDLVACFADDVPVSVVETIANRHPLRAVFRDSCFADSPAKINVYERFKLLSPDTTVKVI